MKKKNILKGYCFNSKNSFVFALLFSNYKFIFIENEEKVCMFIRRVKVHINFEFHIKA